MGRASRDQGCGNSKVPHHIRPLDPFGIFPGVASRIAGLGGEQPPSNSRYAFFTPYMPSTGGNVRFSARFTGLAASAGTLDVAVSVLPRGSMAHSRRIVAKRISLAKACSDLTIELEVPTFPGAGYALTGDVSTDAEASATGLDILWETDGRAAGPAFLSPPEPDPAIAGLIAPGPPTLAAPVSQMCTAAQFEEPEFAQWAAALGSPISRHRKQWEFVFILQALAHTGALRPGARALGFGVGQESLPALFANMGIDVLATDLPSGQGDADLWRQTCQHVAAVEDLRRDNLCDGALFQRHVAYRPVDMNAIPDDLSGFDFTWSSCAFEHLGSIEAGLAFVERSIDCLRPGGIAVHTTELNLVSDDDTLDHTVTVLFRRRDFIRLALRLIAAGHEVAPLCFDPGDAQIDHHVDLPPYTGDIHLKIAFGSYATTSFGIMVRRRP